MNNEPRYLHRLPEILLIALACLLTAANSAAANLNDGLVAYWSFDEGSGGTAYDYSSQGNDGAIYGPTWDAGYSSFALRFDGEDDFVNRPLTASLEIATALSVTAWVRPEQPSTGLGRVVAGTYDWSSDPSLERGWILGDSFGGSDHFYFRVYDSSGADAYAGVGSFFATYLHQWTFVVGVYEPGLYARLYVNGEMLAEDVTGVPSEIAYAVGIPLRIGLRADGATHGPWDGIIDEVRIYNRALSHDEILDLYWSTAHPDPQEKNTEGDQSETSGTSADPVNTATGSFFHQETDLSIPSRGSPLTFRRYYNSKAAAPGRRAAKSKQATPEPKTATSQPASTKPAERSSVGAKKPGKSPANEAQQQAAGSSQPRPKTKEEGK